MNFTKVKATWWNGTVYHLEQLNDIISSTDIKAYAYILHDKDKTENGELKKPHYHFLVQFFTNQRGSWFKRFSSDDMGIVFPQPCYCPKGAFDYLIHDTPTAKKQGKYLYNESERISTIDNFDSDEKPDENAELYTDLLDLLDNKITWHEMIKKKPKRIHMISNILRAYDILYYEQFGVRFFDRQKLPPPPKPLPPKIEIVPIPTPDDMPF